MPRKDIDYSKMCIYKIVCKDFQVTSLYIGSTTDITKRRSKHKYNCNNLNSKEYNFKVYETIRANGGWDNWNVVVIENIPDCINGEQARTRERFWFETLSAYLNMIRPIVTDDENKELQKEYNKKYRVENKEKIIEKGKEYHKENRDKILEYNKTPYVCECGTSCTKCSVSRHKKTAKHIKLMESKVIIA